MEYIWMLKEVKRQVWQGRQNILGMCILEDH